MSMSSSGVLGQMYPFMVDSLMYRDVAAPAAKVSESAFEDESVAAEPEEIGVPVHEVERMLSEARQAAAAETENRIRTLCKAHSDEEGAKIATALERFHGERKDYFSRVESDVVHLALAIAAKILHREATVDPLLVTGLVRVAIDKLHDGSSVSVRVAANEVEKWKKYLGTPLNGSTVAVVADEHLGAMDCVLETDLGSANFSIDAQLKEVEQGFFDLLAQRPAIR